MKQTILSNQIATTLAGLKLSRALYNRAVGIIEYFTIQMINNDLIGEYVLTPEKYFRKKFGTNYLATLIILKKANIIQCNESYSNGINNKKHYPKGYRINHEYLDTDFKLTKYGLKEDSTDLLTETERSIIISDLSKITVDYPEAFHTINEHLKTIKIIINEDIKTNCFALRINEYEDKFYIKREKALAIAKDLNCDLIQYKDKYYLGNVAEFTKKTLEIILYTYTRNLMNFYYKLFYAKRNSTNRRLDTNLTTLPSILLKHFSLNGTPLSSVDSSNSQLTIFAGILKNPAILHDNHSDHFVKYKYTEDTLNFINLCESGQIYEKLGELLNLTRKEAKTKMFQIIFSGAKNPAPEKKLFKASFSQVIEIMDGFKITYGDNQFAIMLQTIESDIFIDTIYTELQKRGITAYTKHDSVLYSIKDASQVEAVVEAAMKQYGIEATLKKETY